MDSIIEEMGRRILDWRAADHVHRHDLERWAQHLRENVQPQLDELARLHAERSAKVAK